MTTSGVADYDGILQRSRNKVVFDPNSDDVVPEHMLIYDESNKVIKKGDGVLTFAALPIYLDLGKVSDISDFYNAMFVTIDSSSHDRLLVVNDSGSAFELTNDALSSYITNTQLADIKENYSDVIHTHELSDITDIGSVSEKNVGITEGTIPVIGLNGKIDESIIHPNAILSDNDSDIISYLMLNRLSDDDISIMHLDKQVIDEFVTDDGVSDENSCGYTLSDEHVDLLQIVGPDMWVTGTAGPDARYFHAAVSDCFKMYVYGGISNLGDYLNDLWMYDINNDTWTQLADGPGARYYHSMVLIGDKVYVFGGSPTNGSYYDELLEYDTITNVWREISDLNPPEARYGHAATVCGDKMYVYGGYDGTYYNDLWVYDPSVNQWSKLANGPYGTYGHILECINNKLYMGAGYDSVEVKNDLYEYNVGNNTWSALTDISIAVRGCGSIVTDNELYIFGGYNNGVSFISDVYRYNPDNDSWTPLTSASKGIKFHSVANLNGHLVSYGGADSVGYIDEVHIYGAKPVKVVQSIAHSSMTEPNESRIFVRAVVGESATLNTDIVFYVSRNGTDWRPVKLSELPMIDNSTIRCYSANADFRYAAHDVEYDWVEAYREDHKNTITSLIVDTADTSGHFDTAIGNTVEAGCIIDTSSGLAIITAIEGNGTDDNSVEFIGSLGIQTHSINGIYGLSIGDTLDLSNCVVAGHFNIEGTNTNDPAGRRFHATALMNNDIYVYGGLNQYAASLNTLSRYDIGLEEWVSLVSNPDEPAGRYNCDMVGINDKLYVYGGYEINVGELNTLRIYNTQTHTWGNGPSHVAMSRNSAVAYDGKMYIYGGYGSNVAFNTLYKYDPVTEEWTGLASNTGDSAGRHNHTAVVNGDKMYIYGGQDQSDNTVNTLYEYDFLSGTWTQLATNIADSGLSYRYYHGACILDGVMYIYGGSAGYANNSMHAYTIATDTWSIIHSNDGSIEGKRGHSMVVYDGKIYVYGGEDTENNILNTLYTYVHAYDQYVTNYQTALLDVGDVNWVEVVSLASVQTLGGSTISYAFGYDDNTFGVYLSGGEYREIARYRLDRWEYWTAGDVYEVSPINTSQSAISKYYEVSGETDIAVMDIPTTEPLREFKNLQYVSVTINGGTPELDTFAVSGTINMGDDAPHGTDICWKVKSNCVDDIAIHGVNVKYS